jgi:hypothetical protein
MVGGPGTRSGPGPVWPTPVEAHVHRGTAADVARQSLHPFLWGFFSVMLCHGIV